MIPRPSLLALLAALLPPAGCDNPACVFGPGNCTNVGGGGGVGDAPATLPVDGEWILAARPAVDRIVPASISVADTHSPIAVFFTESMSPTGLSTSFELQSATGFPVPLPIATLAGDGRVLILLPPAPLTADTSYDLVYQVNVVVADRTGQSVLQPGNGLVGSFTTIAAAAATPKVLGTWPPANAASMSATTEIVVVFDRQILSTTMSNLSFAVTVGMAPPAFKPAPTALPLPGGLATDTRVWRWRSVDAQGLPAPLGAGVHVVVTLSPAGNAIKDTGGAALATTVFAFDTAGFSAPTSAAITSEPGDAIGIDDISGPAELEVLANLAGAQAGDRLSLWMFGREPNVPLNPKLISLHREVELPGPTFASYTMTAVPGDPGNVDLLAGSNPVQGRFADGTVTFAFQLRRGALVSPLRLLDVDRAKAGVQSPALDTIAPTLLGLGTSGSAAGSFKSDQRDLVLVGRASETLHGARVVTPLGDNDLVAGTAAPVVGSHASGLFVAAPVRAGVIDPLAQPVSYTLTIYDRALNSATVSSAPISSGGGFLQVGASGPGTFPPVGPLSVEVFDATTLAPIAGAEVFTHENLGGTVSPVTMGTATTDMLGRATIPPSSFGETILTVVATGYDLFTFDGVPTDRIGIPLQPTVLPDAHVSGTVNSTSTAIGLYTESVADSRAPEVGETLFPASACTLDPVDVRFECPFGPVTIRPRRIGAECAQAVLAPPDPFLFTALTFLRGFELSIPVPPATAGASTTASITFPFLLDEPTLSVEERAIDAPTVTLSSVNWPVLDGLPRVRIEATSPGLPGTATVGQGISFNNLLPPDTWAIRGAYPGAVDGIQNSPTDQLGRLVTQGTVDADLLLRAEVVDAVGNRGGSRPRFSLAPLILLPPAPARLAATPAVLNPGLVSFDLSFHDVLPDASLEPGLYRVTLTDSAVPPRRWTIWRSDQPDASGPDAVVHVPFVGAGNTFPLAPGDLTCRISAWAWPTLDLTRFLWTDVEREHDLFSHSKSQTFTPPTPP